MIRKFTSITFFSIYSAYAHAQSPDFQLFSMVNASAFTSNNFKTIAIGQDGFIWAGTQYQGPYRSSPLIFTWDKSTELTNVFINDIKADKNGGIWVAQSGQTGQAGGGSNIAGGINYVAGTFSTCSFYSVTTGGRLTSRNVVSIWVDTNRVSGSSAAKGLGSAGYFHNFRQYTGGRSIGTTTAGNRQFINIKAPLNITQ